MAPFVFPPSDQVTSPQVGAVKIDNGSFQIPKGNEGVLEIGHNNTNKLENALAYVDWIYDNTEKGDMKPTVDSIPFAKTPSHTEKQQDALHDALLESVSVGKSPEKIEADKQQLIEYVRGASTQIYSIRRYEVERASKMFADALRSRGEV